MFLLYIYIYRLFKKISVSKDYVKSINVRQGPTGKHIKELGWQLTESKTWKPEKVIYLIRTIQNQANENKNWNNASYTLDWKK